MACAPEEVKTIMEHKFARDLICFVLRDHMAGLHWKPSGLFEGTDLDSPFIPQLKAAVKEEMDFDGHSVHKRFDEHFPDKSRIDETYFKVCRSAKDTFLSVQFDIKSFISFSAFLALFAGWSYHYGGTTGTFVSYMLIVQTVGDLKKSGKIDDNIWNEIQNWLENDTEPKRLWTTASAQEKRE